MYSNKKFMYKSGIVKTSTHPVLLLGQVIKIIKEEKDYYIVRLNYNSKEEVIEKQYVITN
jgi:hypothetical protein